MLPYTEMTRQERAEYEQKTLAEVRQRFPTAQPTQRTHPEQSVSFYVNTGAGSLHFWPPRCLDSSTDLWACNLTTPDNRASAIGAGNTAVAAYQAAAASAARTARSLTALLEAAASAETV